MTREQAIEELKDNRVLCINSETEPFAIAYDMAIKALEQEPTTKNDLPHCQCTDAEIAKSFIEDVEAVKDQLPCGEQMDFPNTFDEFAKDYGFKDKNEIYTNGSELIPIFRVKQWLEHISTTKNDLGVDCNNCKNNFHRGDGTSYCATGDGMCHYECEETILDKVRAEIIEKFGESECAEECGCLYVLLDIIDKYKGESENT